MSTIDKFGRSDDTGAGVSGQRGPPGVGYSIDKQGNFTLQNRRLKLNTFDPVSDDEAINLSTLRKYTLHKLSPASKIDAGMRVIKNVALSNDPTSVVNKRYVDSRYPMTVKQDNGNPVIACGNKRLAGLLDGTNPSDAVTRGQVEKYAEVLRLRIAEEIKTATKEIVDALLALHSTTVQYAPAKQPAFENDERT